MTLTLAWSAPAEGARATAASILRATKAWSLDAPPRRFDAEDFWFRAELPKVEGADEIALVLDGIATIADVWIDGELVLQSDDMFVRHERVLAKPGAEIVVCCRSLDAALGARRPRPRWRAPMIENQQLRWFRTSLLGRTPGWSPPAAVVGPWAGVALEARRKIAIDDVALRTSGDAVDVRLSVRGLAGFEIAKVELVVGDHRTTLARKDASTFEGRLTIANVARWWPHTHGEPALHAAHLDVSGVKVDLGKIGFRTVERIGDDFALRVNGAPVFCRGACWTPLDVVALRSNDEDYAKALLQARDAGMNMIRVGGTMVYEADAFYDRCDELGILLWHDFMFANMDYPEDDAGFQASVTEEVRQFLARMDGRPSLAVLCGNSEGEQQAAMFGAARDRWSPKLFHETLPALAKERCPDVPYWPSSAHGGAFPHEPRVGTTSYYGVGAYMLPLDDARRSEVKFATECLAFANVPAGESSVFARSPRDLGAGWDFHDVRDHYVRVLFGVDPGALRYGDQARYLDLGRAATAEVIAATFGEWRRAASLCKGGLVWFLRDLWEGAGWGIVGADGTPKSAWWTMRRACAPVAIHLSGEGNNGVYVHIANDRPTPLSGELEIALFRGGEVSVGGGKRTIEVPAHGALSFAAAELFEGFLDLSYAYRFGPPTCDLVVARLLGHEAFFFPVGLPSTREIDVGLVADARAVGEAEWDLTIRTRRFAQSIVLEAEGFVPDDAWFHLAPGSQRTLRVRRVTGTSALKGSVRALNAETAAKIVVA